jgi:uncharacterized Zn-binding protein involved in type VI secretion
MHICPKVEPGPVPHVGGPVSPTGEPTVLIGFLPAARKGDMLVCVGPPDTISQGEPSVMIGDQQAARQGDSTNHGGAIVLGCPTVIIGSTAQAQALQTDKPFCADCAKQRKSQENG